MRRMGGRDRICLGFSWVAVALAAPVGPAAHADPVCLASRGNTLYRFNGDGNGTAETFDNQAGPIVGMTLIPAGVAVAGCAPGDVLAVDNVKFWRIDNAACGTPGLVEVGSRPPGVAISSIAFAKGQLYVIGDGGLIRQLDHQTFAAIGAGINISTGASNIGGFGFDGLNTWYASDGLTDGLYRFAHPPAPASWELVGSAGYDFNHSGLEIHAGQIWGSFRVPGSPPHYYIGRFNSQTGAFSPVLDISPLPQGVVGLVTLPGVSGLRGDVNCDGSVNGLDVAAFVLALTDPGGFSDAHPDCGIMGADLSGDCQVNGEDIQVFVEELLG